MKHRIALQPPEAADQHARSVSHRLWPAVAAISAISLFAILAAISASQVWFPALPKDLRKKFERLARQIDSPTISFSNQRVLEQQLQRLAEATKQRSTTAEDCEAALQKIFVALVEHSLNKGLLKDYVNRSTLDDGEKAQADRTIRRYAGAFCTGKVDEATAAANELRTTDVDAQGNRRFREVLSDDELRGLLTAMDEAANQAGIAADLPPLDIAVNVCKIVDRQLQTR